MTLVELCAGTASVSLWALSRLGPVTGYMGSKRRWASLLCEALEVSRPARVVLVDAGPWGDVWQTLSDPFRRSLVVETLLSFDETPPVKLWQDLASFPPPEAPAARAAQYLWLQARAVSAAPVWWTGERWEISVGETSSKPATQRGTWAAEPDREVTGLSRPATLARRVEALGALPWDRVEVLHQDVRHVEPIPGAVVYIDPPYLGAPRYAALLPRFDLLDLAVRWADAGARVAISEAEPLPLPGWTARRLPSRKPEWVTASWALTLPEQLQLWEAA